MLHRSGHADFDPELVWLVRFALANALDLRGMQRIDLGSALATFLVAHPASQAQGPGEDRFQGVIAGDIAADVANDATEIGLELAKGPLGTLELMGMGIALVLDQRQLADARIALAQRHAMPLGQPYQDL